MTRACIAAKRSRSSSCLSTCAQNSKKTASQPSSCSLRIGAVRAIASMASRGGFEEGVNLGDAGVEPPLVDREEDVLLRGEVRVDGALRVARLGGHRVQRGGVEALGDEESLGGVDEGGAGKGLALGTRGNGTHTVSIRILLVSVKRLGSDG
jgi:hypothetical protein